MKKKEFFAIILALSLLLFRLRNSLYFKRIIKVLRLHCKKKSRTKVILLLTSVKSISAITLADCKNAMLHTKLGFFRRIIRPTCTYISTAIDIYWHTGYMLKSLLTFRDSLITASGKNKYSKHKFYECILLNYVLTQITILLNILLNISTCF